MREIESNLVKAKDDNVVILHDVTYHHGLIKANRALLLLVTLLMIVIFIMGVFVFPVNDGVVEIFDKEISQSASESRIKNPVLSAEIDLLKGRLVGLVSGSIEHKLKTLELSIRSGNTISSLGTIQGLRSDVNALQSYSKTDEKVIDQKSNAALIQEVSHLKRLIYLTIASCGLMVAAMGGVWIRKNYSLKNPEYRQELGRKS